MKNQSNHPPPQKPALFVDTQSNPSKPALIFDVEHFDKILNRPDIPKDQREAALNDLWHLMGMYMDFGWGVHPLPVATRKSGGQNSSKPQSSDVFDADMLYSDKQTLMHEFIETALSQEGQKGAQDDRL